MVKQANAVRRTVSKPIAAVVLFFLIAPIFSGVSFAALPDRWAGARILDNNANGADGTQWIAVAPNGDAYAVWAQNDGGAISIFASIYHNGDWSTPVIIDLGAGYAGSPRVAVDSYGNALAVWFQSNGTRYDIGSRWYIVGYGWKPAEWAGRNIAQSALYPEVAVDGAGNAAITWWDYNLSSGAARAKAQVWTPAAGWGPSVQISGGANQVAQLQIGADGAGTYTAAWEEYNGLTWHVWTARFSGGTWAAAQQRDSTTSTVNEISLRVALTGIAVLAWTQDDGGYRHLHATRFDPATGWDAPRQFSSCCNSAYSPWVSTDEAGGGAVSWAQWDGINNRIFAVVYDVLTGWSSAAAVSLTTEDSSYPRVASDASGDVVLIYHVYQGAVNRMNATRYTVGFGWSNMGLIQDPTAIAWVNAPIVASAPGGDAFVIWNQWDAPASNVWVNRLQATDRTAPRLRVDTPRAGDVFGAPLATVSGLTDPGARVTVNGLDVLVSATGLFSAQVPLAKGQNLLTVVASDVLLNQRTAVVRVTYQNGDELLAAEAAAQLQTGWRDPLKVENITWGYSADLTVEGVDSAGRVTAVFRDDDGPARSIYASRYDPGVGWSVPRNLRVVDGDVNDWLDVAVDPAGNALVAWTQVNISMSRYELWTAMFNATTGWAPSEHMPFETNWSFYVRASSLGSGRFGVGWYGWDYGNATWGIFTAIFTPGAGWARPTLINGTRGCNYPVFMGTASGNAKVVYFCYPTGAAQLAYSNYTLGGSWTNSTLLDSASIGLTWFESAMDPGGNLTVAWSTAAGPYRIYAGRMNASGWSGATTVKSASGAYGEIWVTASAQGDAMVVFTNYSAGRYATQTARFNSTSGTWQVSGDLSDTSSNAVDPRFAWALDGRGLLIWRQAIGSATQMRGRFYAPATGFGPAFNITRDVAVRWFPSASMDTTGNATVVYLQDNTTANARDLVASRFVVPDTTPPALSIATPASGTTTNQSTVWVSGTTEPGARLRLNGAAVGVLGNGSFGIFYPLGNGTNVLSLTATDAAGNDATATVNITFDDPDRRRIEGLEAESAALVRALADQNASLLAQIAATNSSLLQTVANLNASLLAQLASQDASLTQLIADTNASLLADLALQNSALLATIAQTNASLYADLAAQNTALLAALAGQNASLLASMAAQNAALSTLIANTDASLLAKLAAQNASLLGALADQNADLLASLASQNSNLLAAIALTNSSLLFDLARVNSTLWAQLTSSNGALWVALNASVAAQQAALSGTNQTLTGTQFGLESTNASLEKTQNELVVAKQEAATAGTLAMAGILVGIIGVALAGVAIMRSRRRPPLEPSTEASLDSQRPSTPQVEVVSPAAPGAPNHGHSMGAESELSSEFEPGSR